MQQFTAIISFWNFHETDIWNKNSQWLLPTEPYPLLHVEAKDGFSYTKTNSIQIILWIRKDVYLVFGEQQELCKTSNLYITKTSVLKQYVK